MATIALRFVAGRGVTSSIIRAAQLGYPLTHVEAVFGDLTIGAHLSGGVKTRPIGYDAGRISAEQIVRLEVSQAQAAAFQSFLVDQVGKPYDRRAIADLALAAIGIPFRLAAAGAWQDPARWECAALQLAALIDADILPATGFTDLRHVKPECLAYAIGGLTRSATREIALKV